MIAESLANETVEDLEKNAPHKQSIAMDRFPDSILLDIFSRLDYDELSTCSRVCHRWRILADDFTLKKSIIVKKHLQERRVLSLINNHFTNDLEEFQLLVPKSKSSSLVPITKICFWQMSEKSRKLKKLVLVSCTLPNVTTNDLPSNLLHLSIRDSELSPYTFFGSKPHLSIPHLTCLDLGGCNNFLTSQDLHVLSAFKSLRALYFDGCYRINTGGIESLCEILPQLEILDVEGTDISSEGVCIILNYCSNIKELFLGHTKADDLSLTKACNNAVPNLTYLCVRHTDISSIGLHIFLMHAALKNKKVIVNASFQCASNCFNHPNNPYIAKVDNSRSPKETCSHYLSHKCSRKNI